MAVWSVGGVLRGFTGADRPLLTDLALDLHGELSLDSASIEQVPQALTFRVGLARRCEAAETRDLDVDCSCTSAVDVDGDRRCVGLDRAERVDSFLLIEEAEHRLIRRLVGQYWIRRRCCSPICRR